MRQRFSTEQWLPFPRPVVFAFFANPKNLPPLMPGWQHARIDEVTLVPPPGRPAGATTVAGVFAGSGTKLLITARAAPGLPVRLPWLALIEDFHWDEGFCDVQLSGPFAYWRHCHSVRDEERHGQAGTVVHDEVTYQLPFWPVSALGAPFGPVAMKLMFGYRQRQAAVLLPRFAAEVASKSPLSYLYVAPRVESSAIQGEQAMSIQQTAAEFKAKAQERLGEKFSIIAGDLERVQASGVTAGALKVGQTAPEFTLPDAFGNEVSLASLLAKGPVVISFYRGEWCPFCNIELRGFQQVLPQMQELGATLVAISPEKPDFGIVATEKNQLTFPVLSDFENKVARQFGLVFQVGQALRDFSKNVFNNDFAARNGEDSHELPVPATFVLDTAGVIRFAHVDADYMLGRAEPEDVVAALAGIARPVAQ